MSATPMRRLIGPAIVAIAVVAVTWGSGAAGGGDTAAPVEVSPGLTVAPQRGWEVADAQLGAPWEGVDLTRGAASLTAADATGVAGSPADVLEAYASSQLSTDVADAVFGEVGQLTLPSGRQALTIGYVGRAPDGSPVEGIIIAVLRSGGGVVFDVTAPQGSLVDIADDVRRTVETAVIA